MVQPPPWDTMNPQFFLYRPWWSSCIEPVGTVADASPGRTPVIITLQGRSTWQVPWPTDSRKMLSHWPCVFCQRAPGDSDGSIGGGWQWPQWGWHQLILELSSQYLNTEMLTVALTGSNEDAARAQDPKHDYVHYDHIKGFGVSAERTKNHPTKITPGSDLNALNYLPSTQVLSTNLCLFPSIATWQTGATEWIERITAIPSLPILPLYRILGFIMWPWVHVWHIVGSWSPLSIALGALQNPLDPTLSPKMFPEYLLIAWTHW